jgi:hypothetical protein
LGASTYAVVSQSRMQQKVSPVLEEELVRWAADLRAALAT